MEIPYTGSQTTSFYVYTSDMMEAYAEAALQQRKPLSEAEIEDCIDAANRKFNGRRMGPCGQQLTTYDDWKYWLVREVEEAHGIKKTP
jgi:hypothetical protein